MATTPITSSLPGRDSTCAFTLRCRYKDWMSRSTRSSCDLNGSFRSTVRWAWVVQLEVDPVHREIAPTLLGPLHERTPEPGPGRLGGFGHGLGDGVVGARPFHLVALLQLVEQPTAPIDVVVHEIDHRHLGM